MGAIKIEHLPQYKVADYQRWEGDWELIRGIPYAMSPSANKIHQETALNVLRQILAALDASACPCKVYYELDLILSENTVVRPDLMLFCEDFAGEYPKQPPLLVVEIISKSSRQIDEVVKFDLYRENQIGYYITVDPEAKQIIAYHLRRGKYRTMPVSEPFSLKDCTPLIDFHQIF